MKTCPNCKSQVNDDATFCTTCGAPLGGTAQQQNYQQNPMPNAYPVMPVKPTDHTADFSPEEVHDNKLFALIVYAFSFIGIFLAAIININNKSEYLKFHIKQSLKLLVTEVIVGFITGVLCWTCIIPIAGAIAIAIIAVVTIICFIQTCRNKSIEPPIISSLGFLN